MRRSGLSSAGILALFLGTGAWAQERIQSYRLDALLNRAVAATQTGDFGVALRAYQELERSRAPWYAWAGTSGRVAVLRMTGDFEAARAISSNVAAARPELAGLMAIWDGDTAAIEEDLEGALQSYERAVELHGREWVDGKPIAAIALEQISRARLELQDPRGAAEAQRELLQRYPRFVSTELATAKMLAFEAMEAGELPLKPLEEILHDGDCSSDNPCVFTGRGLVRELPRDALALSKSDGLYISPDAQTQDMLRTAEPLARRAPDILSSATACSVTPATDGFVQPMANDHYGYRFMSNPDCCSGWHPGVDLNGPGPGNSDCGLDFVAVAKGCVRDVMSSSTDWGTAAVEHEYEPGLWTSQYGHGDKLYFSAGQAVAKGAPLGRVGRVGTGSCHLHFEIREEDHTARNSASAYHNKPQSTVGDQYQDPETFIAAHRSYKEVRWVDEDSFQFTGTWQLVNGVGDEDDLKWAYTTGTYSNYARYEWTPSVTGTTEVWAFVPWAHASSTKAPIKVVNRSTGGTVMSKSVNQSAHYDAWVKVGAAVLSAGTTYRLEVATNTAEASRKVAVDDFLIVRTDTQGGGNCIASVPSGSWKGEYFNNKNLSGSPVMVRNDGTGALNFNWGGGSPSSSCGIPADSFSARWTRTVYFNAGTYRFTVTSDDGFRLYIDGALRLDKWIDQAPTTYTIDVTLSAGNHTVRMDYFENAGGAVAQISWQAVSNNCVTSVPSGSWKGEYFNNKALSGSPVMVRNDGTGFLNFDWGGGSPGSSCGIPADNFSARWTRTVSVNAGTHRFTVTSDDGFRLYVDGVLKLDKWIIQAPTTYTVDVALSAGNHTLRLDYFENGGGAVAKLSWTTLSNPCVAGVPSGSWKGEYFNNKALSGSPVMVRNDGTGFLNFEWYSDSPSPSCSFPADNFSVRWTRNVSFNAGIYRFTVTSDDGFRLYVDGVLKLAKWFDQGPTTYTVDVSLSAGNHALRMDYYENGGWAVAKLSWSPVSTGPTVVVIDDLSSGFSRFGPSQYWWQASIGYQNHMYWTYVNGSVKSNYARWSPNLAAAGAGNYRVSVFIPRDNATSQQARYLVRHNGQSHYSSPVNQAQYYDQWVSIGTYYFAANGGEFIELADSTGESGGTYRKIGFDAVKLEKQ